MESRQVLHVDDDESFLETSRLVLESVAPSVDVQTAPSAEEGLQRLRNETAIDCVVSDYEMPGKDGIEFLTAVREEFSDIPFILFTGEGSETVASKAISAGVTDYLQKDPGTDIYRILANRITNAVNRRNAEQKVKRQAMAMDQASEGIAIISSDGEYIEVNSEYAAMHGRDPEDMVGTPCALTLSDEAQQRFTGVLNSLSAGEQWAGDLVAHRANGEVFSKHVSVHLSEPDWCAVVAQDQTESYASDRFSHGANAPSAADIVHTVGDLVYTFDADGNFSFVNQTFCEALSVQPSDLLGEHFSMITAETDIETAVEAFESVSDPETDTTATTYQKRVQTGTGDWIPVETRIVRLPGEPFRGVAGVVRDISDRQKRIRQLETQNKRLNEIARFISHDLNAPLMTLNGRLSLIETDDEEQLTAAKDAVQRMSEMIDGVSDLAADGWSVEETQKVSVDSLVQDAWSHIETGDAVLESTVPDDYAVQASRERLIHSFENIFKNAVDHCESPTVLVTTTPSGLLIADDGPGIEPSNRDAVFEIGYSDNGEGGLGLAHAARNVFAHGWDIRVTESPLGGAGFEIVTTEERLQTAATAQTQSKS